MTIRVCVDHTWAKKGCGRTGLHHANVPGIVLGARGAEQRRPALRLHAAEAGTVGVLTTRSKRVRCVTPAAESTHRELVWVDLALEQHADARLVAVLGRDEQRRGTVLRYKERHARQSCVTLMF